MGAVPVSMHSLPFLAAGAIIMCATAQAAAPTHELDDALVDKLLNLQSRNSTPQLRVAMILEGTGQSKNFESSYVRRVLAIHPVILEGRQIRKVLSYDFNWNAAYGWFLWEKRQERGGEAVWIWSELQGEVVIR